MPIRRVNRQCIFLTTFIFIFLGSLLLSSPSFAAPPGFGVGWNAYLWTYNAQYPSTALQNWVQVVDHDGIASDGSSHTVTVTYPDDSVKTLNFSYRRNETTAYYEYWDNDDPTDDPVAASGDYVYRVTDNDTSEWTEMTDHLEVDALDPPDETYFSPGFGSPVSLAATFDNVYVNGVLYDDFSAGFDASKWQSMPSATVNNKTQTVASGSIVVDGNGADWAGLTPALVDAQGDSTGGVGADIKHVYTAMDATHAYIMVETYSAIDPDAGIEINFDYKPFQHSGHDIRDDLHTNIDNSTLWASNDIDLDGETENFPIAGYTVVRGDVMEASIPLSEIENAAYFNPTFVNIWTPTAPPGDGDDPSHIEPSISEQAHFEYTWDTAEGSFVFMKLQNPETVDELKAQVRIDDNVGNDPYARIGGTYCHDGVGNITARIGVRANEAIYTVYRAYWDGNDYMDPMLLPNSSLGALTPGNRYELTLGWDGATLSFKVEGLDDAVLYTAAYSPSGTLTAPSPYERFIGLTGFPMLNTTTPEFNWNEVEGASHYLVRVHTLNDHSVFTGEVKNPPLKLPPGVLRPDAVYKYRIQAVKEHQWFEADNSSCSERELAYFVTGPTPAQDPFIDFHSHGVYTWTDDPAFGTYPCFWLKIHDAQGVPDNIQSVSVQFPDETTEMTLYHDYNETPTRAVYQNCYFGPPQAGVYTFTVVDKDLNVDTKTDTLILDPVGYPAESSLTPAANTVLGNTALDLNWEDVPGAASYQVDFYDKDLSFQFRVRTTSSDFSLWPGLLKEERPYRYRILTLKDFWEDNLNAASSSPSYANAMPFFTTAVSGGHEPQVDLGLYGVACFQGPHDYTGTPVYYVSAGLLIQDDDGVPENIKEVAVTYPDGVTRMILKYMSGAPNDCNYYFEKSYADLGDIQHTGNSSGVYTFEITDFEDNMVTVTDTLPDAAAYHLQAPSGLAPADASLLNTRNPVITWDPVPGAAVYRVRIFNAAARSTLHWSGELCESFYPIPCGLLDADTTYAYRVYAYDEPLDGNLSFYSADSLFYQGSNRFTTGGGCTADADQDGIHDGIEDFVACLLTADADTDNDGIPDGDEDKNRNGVVDADETDPCNVDSDNDNIQDGTESGVTLDDIGPDTDTNVFIQDEDPQTTTNPLSDDTDSDGVKDGIEDANFNGRVDAGESDPNSVPRRALPFIPLLLGEVDDSKCYVDLGSENFNYYPNGNTLDYQNGSVRFQIDDPGESNDWAMLTYKETISADADVVVKLDYTDFAVVSGEGSGGKIQIGFFGGDTGLKIERNENGYSAWQLPDDPDVHSVPSNETAGTFILEKTGNDFKLYAEGYENDAWLFEDIVFPEDMNLEIDAWNYGVDSISVDVSNFYIKINKSCE